MTWRDCMHLDDLLTYWHYHSYTGRTSSGFGWLHRYTQLENITPISPGQVRLNDTSDLVELQSVKQNWMKYLADKISCLNWLGQFSHFGRHQHHSEVDGFIPGWNTFRVCYEYNVMKCLKIHAVHFYKLWHGEVKRDWHWMPIYMYLHCAAGCWNVNSTSMWTSCAADYVQRTH